MRTTYMFGPLGHVLGLLCLLLFLGSCTTPVQPSSSCDAEKLFTGRKWKLRLLTSLYKPYRQYKPYVQRSVSCYALEYETELNGEEVTLSGVILIPHTKKDTLPLLVYCHGTLFDQREAPSLWSSAIQVQALPAMHGYITFIPDYLGYGTSATEIPAYFDQSVTIQTIQAMIQAGLAYLDDCAIRYKPELYILGYSQGGHAAVSLLQQLESANPTGLEVKATVAIAGPFQLENNLRHILVQDTFHTSAYASYLLASHNHYYWHRPPDTFFRDSSLIYVQRYLAGEITLNQMASNQSTAIRSLMSASFLDDFLGEGELEVKQSLRANSDFQFTPTTPVLIVHSRIDDVVPFETSLETWQNWISRGADRDHVRHYALESA